MEISPKLDLDLHHSELWSIFEVLLDREKMLLSYYYYYCLHKHRERVCNKKF
jgi:hypothetical protein